MTSIPREHTHVTRTNHTHILNPENTFYIYTTGMYYGVAFDRWNKYIRDNIINNILMNYNSIIIHHSDIIDFIEPYAPQFINKQKYEYIVSKVAYIEADVDHPRVFQSTFTYNRIDMEKLDGIHNGRNYIVLDIAHIINYIFTEEKYNNIVSYTNNPDQHFRLNCIYFGVIGNDVETDELIPSKQNLFEVDHMGNVITYIKRIYENHRDLVESYGTFNYDPHKIYHSILFNCKRYLESIWRENFGGLFVKIDHNFGSCDFDDVYNKIIISDNSPIGIILSLLSNDFVMSIDEITEIVKNDMFSIFF